MSGFRQAGAASGASAAEMDGEPYGRQRGIGPFHPVEPMRGDLEIVAGRENEGLFAIGEAQARGAGEQDHPFRLLLIVPEAGRARLAEGDDSLDAKAGGREQRKKLLLLRLLRQVDENIARAHASSPSAGRPRLSAAPGISKPFVRRRSEIRPVRRTSMMNEEETPDALEDWTRRQLEASLTLMLRSISATGLTRERPEFFQKITPRPGSVVASPETDPAAKPDYFFHWLRDSAVVVDALALAIERGWADRAHLRHLRDFVQFSLEIGRLDGPALLARRGAGTTSQPELARYLRSETELAEIVGDHALAEARVNPDGSLDLLKWARPQYDGPALRALALLRRLPLYAQDAPEAAQALLERDLGYVAAHVDEPCYDLWEYRFGHHYHMRLVGMAALMRGAEWAREAGLGQTVAACEAAAVRARAGLEHHWSAENGYYLSAIRAAQTPGDLDLDSAVILAVVEAGLPEGRHSVLDPRVQSTLERLERLFGELFPLNADLAPQDAPLLGRFRGDGYYGGGVFLFATLAAAEVYYRLCAHVACGGALVAEEANRRFLESLGPAWGDELALRLRRRGDSILRAIARHTPESGEMSEQLDKATGAPASARNLAWSYAAFVSAFAAREKSMAPTR